MKILSASQIREADAYTILNKPIGSIDLMERASEAFVDWFINRYDVGKSILVVAGSGNNGGDALAIARILHSKSFEVKVYLALPESEGSADYETNLTRLPPNTNKINSVEDSDAEVVIDGLFGSGLKRAIEGNLGELVDVLNKLNADVVSIDIASGLSCDGLALGRHVVRPTYTISFQLPKLAFMLPENAAYTGNWEIVDIGIDDEFIANQTTRYHYQTKNYFRKLLKPRPAFAHKGTFGHALVVGGSYGKIGAIILTSKGCLRSGAGLVTTLLPQCGYDIIQSAIPEVMCVTSGDRHLEPVAVEGLDMYSAIGIGPGMGKTRNALSILLDLIRLYKKPMVLDADALNILAENPEFIELLPSKSILTPHIGEFERLVGPSTNSLERLKKQSEFSQKYNLIVVLKGAHTSISSIDGTIWFNSTGNPGMATAGSGDVLTGIITGLIAQGYNSLEAAQLGVYLHGKAGDIASLKIGERALIASDIVDHISSAYLETK